MSENESIDKTEIYQIKIKGLLDEKWSDWFDGLTITSQNERETILVGPVLDQGALHGLLAKIRDLSLTLISVEQINKQDEKLSPQSTSEDHHGK
jgi:hypothetical protein